MDRGLSPELSQQYGGLAQMPLSGQAIVIAYNLTALNSTDPHLVLKPLSLLFLFRSLTPAKVVDRETLGLIWAGNISMWNDQRIKDLNPAVANKLPATPIIIGYSENSAISLVEVLKLALESFSPEFKELLAQANRTWAAMPPAQRGTALSAGSSTALRLSWLKVTHTRAHTHIYSYSFFPLVPFHRCAQAHDNSLTYLNYADTVSTPFKWMNMINKAGQLVTPSVAAVQSAMSDFSDEFGSSNFTIDIIDANGTDSWPMAYMNYLSVQQNLTTYDCTSFQELLGFVAWVQTNDAYALPRITITLYIIFSYLI
jgi:ABC-type phosphate transport system substrate-binding protein